MTAMSKVQLIFHRKKFVSTFFLFPVLIAKQIVKTLTRLINKLDHLYKNMFTPLYVHATLLNWFENE